MLQLLNITVHGTNIRYQNVPLRDCKCNTLLGGNLTVILTDIYHGYLFLRPDVDGDSALVAQAVDSLVVGSSCC